MTTADWVQLSEYLVGGAIAIIVIFCSYVWWVRREAAAALGNLANEMANGYNKLWAEFGKMILDTTRNREDLASFKTDIAGKIYTRSDAEVLRRDVQQVQSTMDREMGEIKGQLNLLVSNIVRRD